MGQKSGGDGGFSLWELGLERTACCGTYYKSLRNLLDQNIGIERNDFIKESDLWMLHWNFKGSRTQHLDW